MKIILVLILTFSVAWGHAAPLSSHEKKRKRIRPAVQSHFSHSPKFKLPLPNGYTSGPGPFSFNPGNISFPSQAWPLIIGGVILGGVVSIAIANDHHRRKYERERKLKMPMPALAPPEPYPRREISRAELAAEYEAWHLKKKAGNYLAEN